MYLVNCGSIELLHTIAAVLHNLCFIDDLTIPYSITEPESYRSYQRCWLFNTCCCFLKAASTISVGFPGSARHYAWPRHWRTQIPTLGSQARLTWMDLIKFEESCCDEPDDFVVFLFLARLGSIILPLVQTSHHLLTREHARVYEAGSESEQRADQREQTCPWQVWCQCQYCSLKRANSSVSAKVKEWINNLWATSFSACTI